ncbi:hypothetical protein DBR32_13475 [Taibaiella sp. KBW10]|uniref:DUF5606 family protein n=1 Tax=Taibaiella sp. KBW10 TaxID=2153357 RepID=UPI000F5909E8|nr:DUF5606 domain-containing protein [Taibaiella sp. KBW10]RQO30562.1 hypothetical protein DBR32_13475 [Taibaiella sp. KBW10]
MEYRQIVAVTGLTGLYQLVSTKNDGALVRSLTDKSIKFVSSRVHQITPLESIEIYTYSENVRLHNVLESMKENDASIAALIANKKASSSDFRAYFATVLPEFDQERVYVSDIKKVMKWYELLKANDLLNFEVYTQEVVDMGDVVLEDQEAEVVEEAPKKAAKKAVKEESEEKPAKKAAKKAVKEEGEEKPAKKAAKKAVKEEGEEKPAKKTAKKKED